MGSTRCSILLVDDDPDTREILTLWAGLRGFRVVGECADAAEALDRLGTHEQPDVVILDHQMPGASGGDVAAALRFISPRSAIVAFSGALLSCPPWADAFVPKPSMDELWGVIDRLGALAAA